MGLFRRKAAPPDPDIAALIVDRTWQDPALDAGVDAVAEGHLAAGVALLRETRADPELRVLRTEALADAAVGGSERIAALISEHLPDDEVADLLLWLGRTLISEAWSIRGSGYASTVGAERFKLFHTTLHKAHQPLLAATELRPDDPAPWAALQTMAMGLGVPREQFDLVWQEITRRSPHLYPAHWVRLQILAEKWHGSHDEMFAFARETVRSAPSGHPVTAMLPLAHEEYVLRRKGAIADEGGGAVATVKFLATYYTEAVRSELRGASDRWCAAEPPPHPRAIEAHHLFGAALASAGDREAARWHLGRIGDRVHGLPWGYRGNDPVKQFLKTARRVGAR
ncbi:hypothetical protein [Allonocardiopsis opalescens]|uniref:DUF4034 domain-containing protein n=1 Tax=Allonocardiopsis opalescens TaxID=1144618 RepID=A0A2T0Q0N0_9ACTN|nr:hypothetical protein [Allonocardiopsis opalescens]PRX97351.1 hypothetical protein CLV72_106388 [Allonocardiopsis opalescens]